MIQCVHRHTLGVFATLHNTGTGWGTSEYEDQR
jgi:hypothetical protein